MIISHIRKYLFVEIPHTGTTAISRELCDLYEGKRILRKHAYYPDFLEVASAEEKAYFVFAGVRNPLDEVVTRYFKLKTNHSGVYTNPSRRIQHGGHITPAGLRRYRFAKASNADFAAYFLRFYRLPFTNLCNISRQTFDFVLRFENLQQDFSKVLGLLGVEQERPLPVVNKTADRERDFWSYYTADVRERAIRVFGPFMMLWGYEFPAEWGDVSIPWSSRMLFRILDRGKRLYWRRLKWGRCPLARVFRALWS
jgi:hypothetical protein